MGRTRGVKMRAEEGLQIVLVGLRFGFLVKSCMFRQLEMYRI